MSAHLQALPSIETPPARSEPAKRRRGWRILSSLQIESPDVALHRSVMVGLEEMLRSHNGLSYLDEDQVVISFEIPDASADSREFAHQVLLRAQAMVPTAIVGETELHEVDRDAVHARGPVPTPGLRLAD